MQAAVWPLRRPRRSGGAGERGGAGPAAWLGGRPGPGLALHAAGGPGRALPVPPAPRRAGGAEASGRAVGGKALCTCSRLPLRTGVERATFVQGESLQNLVAKTLFFLNTAGLD